MDGKQAWIFQACLLMRDSAEPLRGRAWDDA